MSLKAVIQTVAAAMLAALALGVSAQTPAPYGAAISLDDAKKVAAAAIAEARKINSPSTIAIVDTGGILIYLEKTDGTHNASSNVAIGKARSAAWYKRPTKAFADALAVGSANTYLLSLEGANMVPGGIPIVMGGKIVGGVGTSGGSGPQDTQVSQAGVDAVK